MAASVSNRLLHHARQTGDDYQFVLLRYALERPMYRLSRSKHANLVVVVDAIRQFLMPA